MKKNISWEALNAYVDGELSPADMAEVARAVMLDHSLAAQVAELTRLRAVTSELRPCGGLDIDLKSFERPNRWYSHVASLLVIPVAGAILGWLLLTQQPVSDSDITKAEVIHQQWLYSFQHVESASLEVDDLLKSSLSALQLDTYVPDLSKVKLSFAGIRQISISAEQEGKEGVHIGYLGRNGCKVSLVVSRHTENYSSSLQPVIRDGKTIYKWRVKHSGFHLLASKMDPRRLDEIARVVYQMTLTRTPLDAPAILALNQAKAESTACTA